jgi:hypothetical protein
MRGCYIFALKTGRGHIPYYVGKAAKQSFEEECFTHHKLASHYHEVVLAHKGIPYLFLVFQSKTKGKWSQSAIFEIEKELIAYAAARNPNVTNKHGLRTRTWRIDGVVASKQVHRRLKQGLSKS